MRSSRQILGVALLCSVGLPRPDLHGLRAQESGGLEKVLELKALRRRGAGADRVLSKLRALRGGLGEATPQRLRIELEEIDLLLRIGRTEGLDRHLDDLAGNWRAVPSVYDRARTLRKILQIRQSLLIEPNAIVADDIGVEFRARLLVHRGKRGPSPREVPRGFPIRFLSGLADGVLTSRDADESMVTVIGFVRATDLADPALDYRRKIDDLVVRGDVILALMVYESFDDDAVDLDMTARPWTNVAVFRFRGSFREFDGLNRRTRYEWLPGPSFFLVEFGGKVLSWCFPWDDWRGFEADVRERLRIVARQ